MKLTPQLIDWIATHSHDDTARLRLRHAGDPDMAHAIMQIECRRKTARKLHETLQNREFVFPTALSAEQCTSDDIACYHASLTSPDETVLDMTAGLGIDAFHIARRATSVTAIDMDRNVAEALQINAEVLGLKNLDAVWADSTQWLSQCSRRFDTIFIDPARRGERGQRLYSLSECQPDVTALLTDIRQHCRRLIVKASPMLDITRLAADLPGVSDIHVIGTRDECKELVAVVDTDAADCVAGHRIHAVTITGNTTGNTLTFTRDEEQSATAAYADPQPGYLLYEPWPAVMKSGAFRTISHRYNAALLHPNTHLYISATELPDFPGTPYRITEIHPFRSSAIKALTRRRISASVSARNFDMTADALRSRLRCSESATTRLIGTTTVSGRIMIIASAIPAAASPHNNTISIQQQN
ncbi:MAG: class I SAM-dependent methyltransferase [Muribaculaceae bacterium]|nr:class I SAM-dependent methyltransferase [Muribaculaceae bacterium]